MSREDGRSVRIDVEKVFAGAFTHHQTRSVAYAASIVDKQFAEQCFPRHGLLERFGLRESGPLRTLRLFLNVFAAPSPGSVEETHAAHFRDVPQQLCEQIRDISLEYWPVIDATEA